MNGRKIVFFIVGSGVGKSTNISRSIGYHGCAIHAGAITKAVATSQFRQMYPVSVGEQCVKAQVSEGYTGHSTRSASTANSGLPMELILEAADWSSASVLKKHYYKNTDKTFAYNLLHSANHT